MAAGNEDARAQLERMRPSHRGRVGRALHLLATDPRQAFRRMARLLRPMPQPYRDRFSMTLREWLVHHQTRVVFDQCHWMGVPSLKNPLDAWVYQEMLFELRPERLVEIGSAAGGSTLYFAHLMDLIGTGEVVSIDVDRSGFVARHPRIVQVTGDSGSAEVIARIHDLCRGRATMLVHDGDHSKGAVLRDLEAYQDLIAPGGAIVVEDGVQDLFRPGDGLGTFEEGPLAAIDEFLRRHPDFSVDATRERYVATYNPRGFLKRAGGRASARQGLDSSSS
jgi:cephalosporin hydroxylase